VSFLVAAALGVGLLIGVPIAAHLLRRGRAREQEFPPTALVPAIRPVARQRSRLEDRLLLAVRVLLVITLALLGATPLVRCSRLSLARESGASVALAVIIDDSLSMRATLANGDTRHQLALDGARELLRSAREGDAIALVLAGRPARLALAATTDLGAARRALDELEPSDRATDLEDAVELARSSLKQLPHVDKRIALFSDRAGGPIPPGEPPVWTPLPSLSEDAPDCGITSAEQRGRRVTVHVACNSPSAARGRFAEIVAASASDQRAADAGSGARPNPGTVLGRAELVAQAGPQSVGIALDTGPIAVDARLDGNDRLAHDDSAPVLAEAAQLSIAVTSDRSSASATTGGTTLLEQALAALGNVSVRPLPVVPDEGRELESHAALVLDDPAGLTPEARAALHTWVERGGVAVALLGPRATLAQLGSTLEPFAQGAVRWEVTSAHGLDPTSASWIGSEAESLKELSPRGRARFEVSESSRARVVARWDDAVPFMIELNRGRGLLWTLGLPSSVDHSDFALRPGFVALLSQLAEQAAHRKGQKSTLAGVPWSFPAGSSIEVVGPNGREEVRDVQRPEGRSEKVVLPGVAGRWQLRIDGEPELRVVTLSAEEITARPSAPAEAETRGAGAQSDLRIDASPELALVALGFAFVELLLRWYGRVRLRASGAADRRRRTEGDPARAA